MTRGAKRILASVFAGLGLVAYAPVHWHLRTDANNERFRAAQITKDDWVAESVWIDIESTAVAVLGVLISLAAIGFAMRRRPR